MNEDPLVPVQQLVEPPADGKEFLAQGGKRFEFFDRIVRHKYGRFWELVFILSQIQDRADVLIFERSEFTADPWLIANKKLLPREEGVGWHVRVVEVTSEITVTFIDLAVDDPAVLVIPLFSAKRFIRDLRVMQVVLRVADDHLPSRDALPVFGGATVSREVVINVDWVPVGLLEFERLHEVSFDR